MKLKRTLTALTIAVMLIAGASDVFAQRQRREALAEIEWIAKSSYLNLRNTNWVFGTKAGLRFSSGVITPFSPSFNSLEGCASISDPAGNLILYTDGVTIRDNLGMIRVTGLQGNINSTQAAVVVPDPGNLTRYYVITSES